MSRNNPFSSGERIYFGLRRAATGAENIFAILGGVVIFGMMLLGTAQVIARWVFHSPIRGFVDVVELSVALFAFLGLAYCQRVGGHIRMDLLLRQLPPRPMWLLETLGLVVGLFVIGSMLASTYDQFLRSWTLGGSTMDLRLPTWPSQLAISLSLGLLWVRLWIQAIGFARMVIWPYSNPGDLPIVGRRIGE